LASLGGVCLNVGCIPSKALLHAAKVIDEASAMAAHGVTFGKPTIDLDKAAQLEDERRQKLTGGLKMLAKQRKVDVVTGTGKFVGPNVVEVKGDDGKAERIAFDQCIIAAGSEAVKLPGFLTILASSTPPRARVAAEREAPARHRRRHHRLEMATVFEALAVKVTVCEFMPGLMPGADPDLVKPLRSVCVPATKRSWSARRPRRLSAEGRHSRDVRGREGA